MFASRFALSGTKTRFPVPCSVSDRFRFICLLIPKNASSTLRREFTREIYDCQEVYFTEVDSQQRKDYFIFATLRDPISRLLSAYQEISMRFDMSPDPNPAREFYLMDDTPERFETFLNELGDALWDPHLLPQVNYLVDVNADFFTCLEQFQEGIEEVFGRLAIGDCPTLPFRRSRVDRKRSYGFDRYLLHSSDLDVKALAIIERVYEADIKLYTRLFPAR